MSTGYYPYENLVFEGGGVKGVAYGGALEVLEQAQIMPQIKCVAGTSAGAITATMVALDYTAAEFNDIMMGLDFKKLEDGGEIAGVGRLVEHYGWFKGDYFLSLMESYVARKTKNPRATFADLAAGGFKDLYVFGTDLSQQTVREFSNEKTPGVAVADAVRISMSIPFFFEARDYDGGVYCDGGVLNNYPIATFDERHTEVEAGTGHTILRRKPNLKTLGFHLDNQDQPPPRPIDDLPRFAGSVFDALLNIQNILMKTNEGDVLRTVFINDLGVKTTDFQLSDQTKWELIAQGRVATSNYLSGPLPVTLPEVRRLVRRAQLSS